MENETFWELAPRQFGDLNFEFRGIKINDMTVEQLRLAANVLIGAREEFERGVVQTNNRLQLAAAFARAK